MANQIKQVTFIYHTKHNYNMDFKALDKYFGQTLAQIAIGGVVTIMIVAVVVSAIIAGNYITDTAVLAFVALITLIVAVVVLSQLVSRM
jgi:hypothetical protein